MADRFYLNCPLAPGPVVLTGSEAHHLATVLRARPGDAVSLFNGDGAEYPAVVAEIGKKQVLLEVTERSVRKRELGFTLAVAAPLPKGDRGDFLIEKLTELGVTEFVPLMTRRSVVQPTETRLGKLTRVVIESSKQCGRNVLMSIGDLTAWEDYVSRLDLPRHRIVAHPGGMALAGRAGTDVAMAVGPEGGFTDEEIAAARGAGWQVVGLGPCILRVETAAIALAVLA